MLRNLFKKRKESGFTIIEVVIVLAIAGLILVVVLVAIPQLQRNQRNTARRNDATRVGTAVSTWASNNNGAVFPTAPAATENAAIDVVQAELGNLSQYDASQNSTFDAVPGATAAVAANTSLTQINIVTGAKCGTSGATTPGTTRQIAIQYATETSSGTGTGQCIEI